MKGHILIIDDDLSLTELIKKFLENHQFKVSSFDHPKNALNKLDKKHDYDLIILDIMLPEIDGFQVLRKIRQSSTIPIIMLTARGEVSDRVVGLELGADDYLPKPFEPEELIARIQSILRRIQHPEAMVDKIIYEHLTIDKLTQEVSLNDVPLRLSTTEFEALLIFAENGGEVLDRDFLVENLRGISWQSYDRSIDVLVSRLRTKLNKLDPNTEYIKTIHGVGYKFIDRIKK
jgi:DNA-binding response OmpR family regulator|tara:strand:- start:522 stop:1217 length:696 start_codon:yes stop_codon:yes gene_type:complete